MARNQVQFQKGLGMAEFTARYGTEDQCHEALVIARQSGWERRVNQDENWRPRIMIVVGGPFDKCVCAANV